MTKYNLNPKSKLSAREHRPLRWITKQIIHEEGGYSWELITGYDANLSNILPRTALNYARENINRYGGKLYACYGDPSGPVLITD